MVCCVQNGWRDVWLSALSVAGKQSYTIHLKCPNWDNSDVSIWRVCNSMSWSEMVYYKSVSSTYSITQLCPSRLNKPILQTWTRLLLCPSPYTTYPEGTLIQSHILTQNRKGSLPDPFETTLTLHHFGTFVPTILTFEDYAISPNLLCNPSHNSIHTSLIRCHLSCVV